MTTSFLGGNRTTPWIACTLWFIVSCLAIPTRFRILSAAFIRSSSPRSISGAVTRLASLFAADRECPANMTLVRSIISSASRSLSHVTDLGNNQRVRQQRSYCRCFRTERLGTAPAFQKEQVFYLFGVINSWGFTLVYLLYLYTSILCLVRTGLHPWRTLPFRQHDAYSQVYWRRDLVCRSTQHILGVLQLNILVRQLRTWCSPANMWHTPVLWGVLEPVSTRFPHDLLKNN